MKFDPFSVFAWRSYLTMYRLEKSVLVVSGLTAEQLADWFNTRYFTRSAIEWELTLLFSSTNILLAELAGDRLAQRFLEAMRTALYVYRADFLSGHKTSYVPVHMRPWVSKTVFRPGQGVGHFGPFSVEELVTSARQKVVKLIQSTGRAKIGPVGRLKRNQEVTGKNTTLSMRNAPSLRPRALEVSRMTKGNKPAAVKKHAPDDVQERESICLLVLELICIVRMDVLLSCL